MVFIRGLAALVAVGFMAAATAFGCGGLSDAEANTRCTQEQASKKACFDPNVLLMCESCFERCGDSCLTLSTTCPLQYLCPGDSPLDAGSDGL